MRLTDIQQAWGEISPGSERTARGKGTQERFAVFASVDYGILPILSQPNLPHSGCCEDKTEEGRVVS